MQQWNCCNPSTILLYFMNEINNKPFYWKSSKFISQLSYNLQDLENYFSEKGRVT